MTPAVRALQSKFPSASVMASGLSHSRVGITPSGKAPPATLARATTANAPRASSSMASRMTCVRAETSMPMYTIQVSTPMKAMPRPTVARAARDTSWPRMGMEPQVDVSMPSKASV